MKRGQAIRRRWCDILVLSGLGAAIALPVLALGVSWLRAFSELSPWIVGSGCFATLAFLLRRSREGAPERAGSAESQTGSRTRSVGRFRRLAAYLGLKHFVVYPPVWVAGVVGAGLLTVALEQFPSVRQVLGVSSTLADGLTLVGCGYWVIPILVPIATGAMACFSGYPPSPEVSGSATNVVPLHASWERLRAWLENDNPVVHPEDDAFKHAVIARRIARRLREHPTPAQAVVGGLGTGKTTLRCLVEHELGLNSKTHILPVELWPYDTPQAAVEGVLRTLVQGLALEVNVLAARGLPEEYVAAINAAGGFASNLANLASKAGSPFDVLETVDGIATAIDHRFIVWVEDLERFARTSGQGDSLEESDRLAPLRALLFGLSELTSVGVITATTSLHARFDTEKIARYVEELPPLEFADAARILQAFRVRCRMPSFINPAPSEARRAWDAFDSPEGLAAHEALGGKGRTLPNKAVSLCRTPRTLKQGLRRTLSYWEAWTGEVDFDDLLVMHLFRVGEPAAFAVVRDHWNELVRRYTNGRESQEGLASFRTALNDLKLGVERAESVDFIVEAVFLSETRRTRPQGLTISRYWNRFLAEPELAPEDRDQAALQVLRNDDDDAVLDLLEGPQSRVVENFERQLSGERLLRLLVPLVRRRVTEDPSGWPTRGVLPLDTPPGLIPLWRMLLDTGRPDAPSATDVSEALVRAFEESITNLHLVHTLDYYFLGTKEGEGCLYGEGIERGRELKAAARERMWALFVGTYRGSPQALINGLRGSNSWTLSWIVWRSHRKETKEIGNLPFADWSMLAPTILAACRTNRQLMLPQLAALVTRKAGETFRDGRFHDLLEFDAAQAEALFGSEDQVLGLFVDQVEVEPDARDMVEAVRTAALQWHKEQHTPEGEE